MKKKKFDKLAKKNIEQNLELCGSDEVYYQELERICTEYSEADEQKIEQYVQTLIKESDENKAPYRAGIQNVNFAIVAVLDRLINETNYPIKTTDIYKINTEEIHKIVETHIQLLQTINAKKRKNLQEELQALQREDPLKHKEKINSLSKHIERLKDSKKKIKISVFANDDSTYKPKRDAIEKALKFLSVYNVITYVSPNAYKLNMQHWFNYQRFSLNNTYLLVDLLPLLAAFLKYNAPNRVDNFLSHIDKIVGFTLQAPKNHAAFANIENYIIRILSDDTSTLSFKLNKTNSSLNNKVEFENVDTLQILFEQDRKKYLKFEEHNKKYQVRIEDILYLKVPDKTETSVYWKDTKCFVIFNDMYEHNHKIYQDRKKEKINEGSTHYYKEDIEVIFEANTNMKDLFDLHVLKNTVMYIEEAEKESFTAEIKDKIDLSKDIDFRNKIYITGKGCKDDILSYAQRSGTDIKLLYPKYLVAELKKIIRECELMYE
ncbi:hypothetical protein [Sulfurimonas sp. NW9]|uniref:hypothetical protein n=1 Tax=Sulfurimonas sp. NW9 TaxID=2922728 RepID=UPI003DA8EEC8